ncbi:MAG: phosphatase PAP2 family protein [Gemmatimonadota bacterium]
MNSGRRPRGLLAVDRLALGYLWLSGLLALASFSSRGALIAALHAGGTAAILAVARRDVPGHRWLAFLRLAYPVAATPLLYSELAWLNQLLVTGYFDGVVQSWEQALFGVQLSVDASRWLPHLWISEILHAGYASYYVLVPGAALGVYLLAGRRALHEWTFTVGLAFFVCYLIFSVFPVAGPRYAFPPIEGPPARGFFFALVHRILEGGSSKGTAFPSSHVAAAVTAWLAAGRHRRVLLVGFALPAVTLVLGTVYGRFHYGIDALAGIGIAGLSLALSPALVGRAGALPDTGNPSGAPGV